MGQIVDPIDTHYYHRLSMMSIHCAFARFSISFNVPRGTKEAGE